MTVYEVCFNIDYSPHVSYGFFLNRSAAEKKLKELISTERFKHNLDDYYVEEHVVNVD
jgi:hypothetical protein